MFVLESYRLGKKQTDYEFCSVFDQLGLYETLSSREQIVGKQNAFVLEIFGMKLQVGGFVLPVRAFELGTVCGQGDGFVAVGYPDVRREFTAKLLVADAVLFTGGCRNGYQDGTVLVLLNDTDAADSDGKEFGGEVCYLPGLEFENKVGNFLAFKRDLVVTTDGAIIIQVKAQAPVQTEETLKTVIQREKGFAEIFEEGKDKYAVPQTGFVLAAGFQIIHETCQMTALVQAHADSEPFVEIGLADDVPAVTGELCLVIGTGFEKEIEFPIVLETDHVLAPEGDLA